MLRMYGSYITKSFFILKWKIIIQRGYTRKVGLERKMSLFERLLEVIIIFIIEWVAKRSGSHYPTNIGRNSKLLSVVKKIECTCFYLPLTTCHTKSIHILQHVFPPSQRPQDTQVVSSANHTLKSQLCKFCPTKKIWWVGLSSLKNTKVVKPIKDWKKVHSINFFLGFF